MFGEGAKMSVIESKCFMTKGPRTILRAVIQGKPADLVVCQGVLQYLDDAEATAALERLHALTRTALYLEVLTELDLQVACDTSRTDGEVFLRTGKWYWEALAGKFIAVGGGLFLPTDTDVPLFELESLDPRL